MSIGVSPPPVTGNLQVWAQNVVAYLRRTASRLQYKPLMASAAEDATLLWDAAGGYPVVAKGGRWRQVVLSDGYGSILRTTNQTAPAVDTAYKVSFDDIDVADITVTSGTEVTVPEDGLYLITISVQISSTSSSAVDFRVWLRRNNVDLVDGTIVASLHNNNATNAVARTVLLQLSAGDVVNLMWATSSTSGFLHAHAATAFAPASPAAKMVLLRVQG